MAWVTPSNVATGDVLTASKWNQDVVENWNALGDAWTAYTPTWTNLTVGNATQNSAYIAIGKLHIVRIFLKFGSTTSISGIPEITLPNGVSFSSGYAGTTIIGTGNLRDASGGTDYMSPLMRSASTAARLRFLCEQVNATYAAAAAISASVPMTWAVDDEISGTFTFEAA